MLPNLARLCTVAGAAGGGGGGGEGGGAAGGERGIDAPSDVVRIIAEQVAKHNVELECKVTVKDDDRELTTPQRSGKVMRVREGLLSISWNRENTTREVDNVMSKLVDRALELLRECHNNYPKRIMVPDSTNKEGAARYGLDLAERVNSMTHGKTQGSPYAYRLFERPNQSIGVFMEEGTGPGYDSLKESWFEHLMWTCDTVWRQFLWLLANPKVPQELQQKPRIKAKAQLGDDLSGSARVFVVDEASSFGKDFWDLNKDQLMEHPFDAIHALTLTWSASERSLKREHEDLLEHLYRVERMFQLMEHPFDAIHALTLTWSASDSYKLKREHEDLLEHLLDRPRL